MPTLPTVRRVPVMVSIMAATFMIAVEATIVSTAMPQIAGQLGDLHLYAWVFASFLLTQTATTVVFGKMADLYGRKPVLLVGIAVFLLGSVLCGLAPSMTWLIVFRLIQGAGAGAIQPTCLTIVGDLFPGAARGKAQGYLASVWGISSVVGPLAGGLIIQHLSWAWIFWINVPLGLAACAGFSAFLKESVAQTSRNVDVAGAALFFVAVASLMVALTELGTEGGGITLAATCVFVISTVLFVLQERRARDPMMVFRLWVHRPIATSNAATLLSGMVMVGLTAFLPMYVQAVMNRSALAAGFTLTIMVLGWPIGSMVAAKVFPRYGLRPTLLVGTALLPLGSLAFLMTGPADTPLLPALGSMIVGFGMGLMGTPAIVLIQGSVGWAERGVATASNVFSRNLGSTLGATVLGGVLNLSLAHRSGAAAAVDFSEIRQLLDHPGTAIGDPMVRAALDGALHLTFWTTFLIAVLTLLAGYLVPPVVLRQEAREVAAE